VADATVTAVVSDFEDRPPGSFAEDLQLDTITGNYVVLDLGNGVHAMANHLQHGSPTVKVGDTVTKGQVIGRVGNSGNTSQPHLHFQLYRGIAPLSGDNVPFQIDQFTFTGEIQADGTLNRSAAGPRTDQYPLAESVVRYPTS
jgi:murein DD-endopeptidase MepM/ murein hydrolase activator NlpD